MHLMKCADTMGRLRRVGLLIAIGWAAAIVGANSGRAADACAALKDLKIEDATITAAESVPAGSFTAADSKSYANLPAFCRVTATVSPVHDSAIRLEMWLPQEGWKGVFEGTGNGGYGGRFIYPSPGGGTASGLCRHQHRSGNGSRHGAERRRPRRSPGEMARLGVSRDASHDGRRQTDRVRPSTARSPSHAYFPGCSTGGQQALDRSPALSRRITTASPPARPWSTAPICTPPLSGAVRRRDRTPGGVLGHDKLMLLKKAVVAACAPGAGGAASDTFVADPLHCAFDPASLVCKAGDAPDCLTPEQAETVKRFYAGPTNPRTGEQIYPGWPRGSEGPAFGWALEEGDPPLVAQGAGLRQPLQMGVRAELGLAQLRLRPRHGGSGRCARTRRERRHGRQHRRVQGAWRQIAHLPRMGGFDRQSAWHHRLLRDARQGSGRSGPVAGSARLFLLPGVEHCGLGGGEGPDAVGSEHGLPAPRSTRSMTFSRRSPNGSRPEPRQRS